MLLQEYWKPVNNYEGLYEVSNTGKVRRLYRTRSSRECKPFLRDGKYLSVGLSAGNKVRFITIHTLVARAFVDNTESKPTVNHIDGNKLNNHASNLEWATKSEQLIHANRTGIFKSIPPTKKGDKLSEETKRKMSESRMGRQVSESTRLKISNSLLKNRNNNSTKKDG